MILSSLTLIPYHREGTRGSRDVGSSERWAWDFVVDGQPLSRVVPGDVVGVLGWGSASWQASVVERLFRQADSDLPPDRVALYVCPECGDLGCGAVTAVVRRSGETIQWSDLRYETDRQDPDEDVALATGPFTFEWAAYAHLLRAALERAPGPNVAPITAA